MDVARVKLALGPAWWQTWRAKCALAADGAAWGAVREHAGVLGVVSSVVRVAARVAKPGDRPSYRIFSGHHARGPGSTDNSPADGREKAVFLCFILNPAYDRNTDLSSLLF